MPVDIYLNGSLFFNRVFFTQFSPYLYVPEGSYEVTVFVTMTKENPILRQNIEVKNGELATLAMTGNYDDIKLLLIPEDKEGASGNNSKVRVVHLSPNLPELNILAYDSILFSEVDFREITEYIEMPSQFYKINIELSQNNRLLRSNRIAINPNRIYTLYLMGNFANSQVFQSLDGAAFISPVVRYK
jgi:hypothetical protein